MKRAMWCLCLLTLLGAFSLAGGCLSVKTQNEIKPIHITVDVNLRVQKDLNDFFGDIDKE